MLNYKSYTVYINKNLGHHVCLNDFIFTGNNVAFYRIETGPCWVTVMTASCCPHESWADTEALLLSRRESEDLFIYSWDQQSRLSLTETPCWFSHGRATSSTMLFSF